MNYAPLLPPSLPQIAHKKIMVMQRGITFLDGLMRRKDCKVASLVLASVVARPREGTAIKSSVIRRGMRDPQDDPSHVSSVLSSPSLLLNRNLPNNEFPPGDDHLLHGHRVHHISLPQRENKSEALIWTCG